MTTLKSGRDDWDQHWAKVQYDSFQTWGRPASNDPQWSKLYFAVQTISKIPPRDRASADISQYRDGKYFRETRFYRIRGDGWVRTRPDGSFWSGQQQTLKSRRFTVTFPNEDISLAQAVLDRFEAAYDRLCADLNCPADPGGAPDITLAVQPEIEQAGWVDRGHQVAIRLPSPRVLGVYDRLDVAGDPITAIAYDSLILPVARVASGGNARWSDRNDGELFVRAIVDWERDRRSGSTGRAPDSQAARSLGDETLPPLASLWSWPLQFPPDSNLLDRVQREAAAMVAFVEVTYGPHRVTGLLNAFARADSLPEAVDTGVGVDYVAFEAAWRAWLGAR